MAGHVPATFKRKVALVRRKLEQTLKDVDVCIMHNVLTTHFNLILTAALADVPVFRKLCWQYCVRIRDHERPATIARHALETLARSPRIQLRKKVMGLYSWDIVFADLVLPAVVTPESVWTAQ